MLVVRIVHPPAVPRRRLGRAKPKDSDPTAAADPVPMTTLTVVVPEPFADERAGAAWLAEIRDDDEAIDAEIDAAIAFINRAVHAHRAAVGDPGIPDVVAASALAVRLGFGEGVELSEGRYAEAIEVPASERRRRRAEALRPTERVAGVLAGRESVAACELLLLRARADLDAGRAREAALQLRSGVEAMLADREAFTAPGQEGDLAALEEGRAAVDAGATAALADAPNDKQLEAAAQSLGIAERVLRRERASR